MGTHPIFESDFDCLTEIGGRDRAFIGMCAGSLSPGESVANKSGAAKTLLPLIGSDRIRLVAIQVVQKMQIQKRQTKKSRARVRRVKFRARNFFSSLLFLPGRLFASCFPLFRL